MSAADVSTARSKTVSWEDPSISAAAMASVSGRELLEAIVDGRLPRPPMAGLIDARLTSVGEGVVVFECTPDESTYNPIGLVHGGLLCTLLDSAAGCAVHSLLPAGVSYSSIEIKVSFLAPVRADSGTLEVEGRALRVGRQVAFAEAHARTQDGKLVGHATSSLAVMRP
ncbi:MAG TPA: PaaI family thioesterase [Solirubrobacteraceae bacterium]|nr:PaaI family thioesterase [Solirubrobacteraceae bacterium]